MAPPLTKIWPLSDDQQEVFDQIIRWLRGNKEPAVFAARQAADSSILTVGGLGGTGKTTLLGHLAHEIGVINSASDDRLLPAYVAYTGRASSILGRKLTDQGVQTTRRFRGPTRLDNNYFDESLGEHSGPPLCTTIHGLLYRPVIDPKTEELRGWAKREFLDRKYDVIVVDEASMVSDEILRDILAHNVPVLAVGDHGQLPPVMASGALMQSPRLKLEKIHRQAEGSAIIRLAHHVRNGGQLDDFQPRPGEDAVQFLSKRDLPSLLKASLPSHPDATRTYLDVGLLCWKNETRVRLNGEVRRALGFNGIPKQGEVVVCLRNNPPVFNGMRGVLDADVENFDEESIAFTASYPFEKLYAERAIACSAQFNRPTTFASLDEMQRAGVHVKSMKEAGQLFDFGYALTVHKSQGSQFDHAVIYLDRPEKPWDEDYCRWMYTAITRAAEKVTVLR
jgi:exodeoxyribonuclease-5